MRKLIVIGASIFLGVAMFAPIRGLGQTKDPWELVETKTSLLLGDYDTLARMSNALSELQAYEGIILSGLGCSAKSGAATPRAGRTKVQQAPCKFEKLYIDRAADGTASGRAMAAALVKALKKDGRVELVTDRQQADAVLVSQNEMTERVDAQKKQAASRAWAQLAADARSGRKSRYIAYLVDSQCPDADADFTYATGPGATEQESDATPWVDLEAYSAGTNYYLSAQKHDGSDCDITAKIYSLSLTAR